ncbi:MAG: hypothetical protein AB7U73_05160 [Pirellulales bacterium]
MALTFLCPNGHRLSCADEQAGLAGQCPECGVRFRIPLPEQPSGATATDDLPDDEVVEEYDAQESEEPASEEDGSPGLPERIDFLCPNGHRLHGPPHLAGRAGQCPHCGAKFRIPPLEDDPANGEMFEPADEAEIEGQLPEEEATYAEEEVAAGEAYESYEAEAEYHASADPATNGSAEYPTEFVEELPPEDPLLPGAAVASNVPAGDDWPGMPAGPSRQDEFLGIDPDAAGEPAAPASVGAGAPHPLAELCDRLWAETPGGAKIELVLGDGNHLVVHHFARGWSQRSHGLFACREGDGTYTLTAIAWESISRVIARGLPDLAEDLGE